MPAPARLLLTALLLCLALAGCGRAAGQGVTFSTWGSIEEIDTLKPILAAFAKQSGIPVELVHIPEGYDYKLRLLAAAGKVPDVMFVDNQIMAGFADRGVFLDLGPYLDRDDRIRRADFYPQVLEALSWKGTLYGIPRDLSNIVMYYNQDMFDAARVPYPKAGWTWEDALAKAKRLTKGDEQFGISFAPQPLYWLPWVWSAGGDVMDRSMTRAVIADPASVQAMQFYADLRHKHHVAPTDAQAGNARMSQLFAQGKLAMLVQGRWVIPGFRKKIQFRWDVAPFPRGSTGSVVDADSSGWFISANCPHPDQAWQLVRFLASRESIAAFTESGLIVPSRPDVAKSAVFNVTPPASNHVFLDVIPASRPTWSPPSYLEIREELIQDMEPAWAGRVSVAEAVAPLARRVQALLDEDQGR